MWSCVLIETSRKKHCNECHCNTYGLFKKFSVLQDAKHRMRPTEIPFHPLIGMGNVKFTSPQIDREDRE